MAQKQLTALPQAVAVEEDDALLLRKTFSSTDEKLDLPVLRPALLQENLTSIAALGTAANKALYTTAENTWAEMDVTSGARTFLAATTNLARLQAIDASQSPLDEDDFASDSATRPPSQQSTKAYVDAGPKIRAWVNFDGSGSIVIRESFNVSSVVDNGTGDFTVNFSQPMNNSNYALSGSTKNPSNVFVTIETLDPTFARIVTPDRGNQDRNPEIVTVMVVQ